MLETLGPQVAGRDAEVLRAFALVLKFLLNGKGLVHGRWLKRLGEGV